jgi:hypothetical protein
MRQLDETSSFQALSTVRFCLMFRQKAKLLQRSLCVHTDPKHYSLCAHDLPIDKDKQTSILLT